MSKKSWILFSLIVLFSVFSTSLLIFRIIGIQLFAVANGAPDNLVFPSEVHVLMSYGASFENSSYFAAPTSWLFLGIGIWIWRGKARILFRNAGFDKDVFRLLLRTKGGNSRVKLLKALLSPKDRSMLSKELGLDWKAVNRHLKLLQEFGLIREEVNIKTSMRLFTLSKIGEMLLNVLENMEELEKEYNNQSVGNRAETIRSRITS